MDTSPRTINSTGIPKASRESSFDARLAFLLMLAFSISLFFAETWTGLGAFALFLGIVLLLARPAISKLAKGLLPLGLVLGFTVLAHLPQGLGEGTFYAIRILLVVLAMLTLTFSYDDTQFVRAFSSLLSPLRSLRVPVDDFAMIFSIALRFIPLAMEEFLRVAKAQRARAAKLDDGPLFERIRRWGSVLSPMLVSLFRRTSTLAQAMESRCYGRNGMRTNLHGKASLGAAETAFALAGSALCILAGILL